MKKAFVCATAALLAVLACRNKTPAVKAVPGIPSQVIGGNDTNGVPHVYANQDGGMPVETVTKGVGTPIPGIPSVVIGGNDSLGIPHVYGIDPANGALLVENIGGTSGSTGGGGGGFCVADAGPSGYCPGPTLINGNLTVQGIGTGADYCADGQCISDAGKQPFPNACVDGGNCDIANATIGELSVLGDAGVTGNVNVGGNLTCSTETVTGTLTVTTVNAGSLNSSGDAGITGNIYTPGNILGGTETVATLTVSGDAGIGNNAYLAGNLTCSTETVTSETVSTLTVLDDAGVGGNLNVGGAETVTGLIVTATDNCLVRGSGGTVTCLSDAGGGSSSSSSSGGPACALSGTPTLFQYTGFGQRGIVPPDGVNTYINGTNCDGTVILGLDGGTIQTGIPIIGIQFSQAWGDAGWTVICNVEDQDDQGPNTVIAQGRFGCNIDVPAGFYGGNNLQQFGLLTIGNQYFLNAPTSDGGHNGRHIRIDYHVAGPI